MLRSTLTHILAVLLLWLEPHAIAQESDVRPTLDDYFGKPDTVDVALSPDGEQLAMIQRFGDDTNQLVIYRLGQSEPVASLAEHKGMSLYNVEWLTNERLLVFTFSKRQFYRTTYRVLRLYAVNADGSDQLAFGGDGVNLARLLSTLPDNPDHVLMLGFSMKRVYRVNIHDGKTEMIMEGGKGTLSYATTRDGKPHLRFDYNEWRRTITMLVYDTDTSEWRSLTTYKVHLTSDDARQNMAAFEGGNTLLALVRKDGDEYTRLYRYDTKRDEYTGVVHAVDGYDLSGTISNPHTGELLGVTYIASRPEHLFFDERHQAVQDLLEQAFPNGEVKITAISDDSRRFLFINREPWHPGSYNLYDARARRVTKLADINVTLASRETTRVDEIRYLAEDGMPIYAYLTRPAPIPDGKLALIVFPHGGPLARDYLGYNRAVQYWASRGYAVLQPNFRGSSGYGRTFEEAGHHEYGGAMIGDIRGAVRAVVKLGYVDSERVCSAGFSYGGYATLMLALEPGLLRCGVSVNAPVDYRDRIESTVKGTSTTQYRREYRAWADETIGNIDTQQSMLRSMSPLHRYREFDIPLLLINAEDDRNVSPRHSRGLRKKLRKAHKDVEVLTLKQGGHGLRGQAYRKVVERATEFLSEHLQD